MTPLLEHLLRLIAVDGPISVARYMTEALSHPQLGYYATRDPFGRQGDFITAPEVSQMFGELLGLWCAQTWQAMGAPASFALVELGPGRGTAMADALRAAAAVPGFSEACRVHLVELSPTLKVLQRQALSAYEVTWHGHVDEVRHGPAIVLANEFFDALPVRQFQRDVAGWRERLIAADGETLRFTTAPAAIAPALLPHGARDAAPGAVVEVAPARDAVMAALATRLAATGGAALIIDYGYDVTAAGETLQAVKGHRYHPVLDAPGEADITAHVDFTALAAAATAEGAICHGPVEQGVFLETLGIHRRAAALMARASAQQSRDIAAARDRLISPGAMGRLFKVLAVTAPGAPTPAGFEHLS